MNNYMPRNLKTSVKWTSFKKQKSSKLNEEEDEILKRLIIAGEIEAVVKKLPGHKSPALDSFTGKFYKTLKEELAPILQRLFPKIQDSQTLFMKPASS